MRQKRTAVDFSKHIHEVEFYTNSEGKEIRVDYFHEKGKRNRFIKFINDDEGMSVYGEYGNWIFCRQFIPSDEGYVSDGYWCEKLSIGSQQEYSKFNSKATEEELQRMINSGLEEYGYQEEELEQTKEWFKHLLNYVEDEFEYTYELYRGDNPTEIDYEYLPFIKDTNTWLKIIFDAFDEMCRRLDKK